MTSTLFTDWSIMRIVRLAFGIIIIFQALDVGNYWLMIPGGIFLVLAIFNAGCGANGCAMPTKDIRFKK